jgi:GT2 family glycosyltransferase
MQEKLAGASLNICICTYNRVGYLKRCLEKLIAQVNNEEIVITVIDNNSNDGTKDYIRSLGEDHSFIGYVLEPAQGLSYARNAGWISSQSDWILYLDDDCLPSDIFVSAALTLIKSGDAVDAYGGPIDALFENDIPNWLPEGFGSFSMPHTSLTVIEKGFIRGGCFMIRRRILQELHGFDDTLGVSGEKLHYGEEIELQLRMRKAGLKIAYAPSLRTGHFVRAEKLRWSWVLHSEYARRRDKMLFEPVPFLVATFHLLKTAVGRLFWMPVHFGEAIFNRTYSYKKALYQIAQPMAFSLGEWVGVLLSRLRK